MAIVYALLAAASFGVGDFLGGVATRRGSGNPVPIVAIAHSAGLVLAAVLVVLFPGDLWSSSLAIGAGAGVVGAVGLAYLYRGLAAGRMGMVAPLAAVLAAVIPVTWGLLSGERPSMVSAIGVACGLVAIPLVASEPRDPDRTDDDATGTLPAGFVDGLLAGIGFGLFFVLIDLVDAESGAVPLLGARLATVPVFVIIARRLTTGLTMTPGIRSIAIWSGLLDMAANGWFLAAIRIGLITEVVVLTALAPAATIALARLVEYERLSIVQIAGLPLAIAGVALIGVGS